MQRKKFSPVRYVYPLPNYTSSGTRTPPLNVSRSCARQVFVEQTKFLRNSINQKIQQFVSSSRVARPLSRRHPTIFKCTTQPGEMRQALVICKSGVDMGLDTGGFSESSCPNQSLMSLTHTIND